MKSTIIKTMFSVLLLMLSAINTHATAVSEKKDSIPLLSKGDYLKQSKDQKATAIVMLSFGGAAFLVGAFGNAIIFLENASNLFGWEEYKDPTPYILSAIVGGTLALSSIPLFHLSYRNKQRSRFTPIAYLKMENTTVTKIRGSDKTIYPAIGIKIKF